MNSAKPLGPWKVTCARDRAGAYNDIEAPALEWPESKIALVSCDNPRYREIQALIVAAPELLALLREAENLAVLGDVEETTEAYGWGAWLKNTRAILEKVVRS